MFYAVWPEVAVIMAEPRIWQDIVYNTSLEIEITNQVIDLGIVYFPEKIFRVFHRLCRMSVLIEGLVASFTHTQ